MCSIFGFSGHFDRSLLQKAIQCLHHRGPDDNGHWYNAQNKIGLAHTRLSILDLSSLGHQPMVNPNTNQVITYNGEIYNFKLLKCELEAKGYQFKSRSDTEVLLRLYEEYGTKMLEKLNGIFAFCIWDPKNESLFIARDPIGVKPLYYSDTNNGFIFSSELKALLLDKRISRELNTEAIHYYMSYLWCPAPSTMLNQVHKLEPGHALLIKNNHIFKKWCYYDIPYTGNYSTLTENELIEKTHFHLKQAVERQLVSDVPVGAFLSGGIDSSSIVALAKQLLNKPLDCFTIKLKNTPQSEGFEDDYHYAKEVASYLDVPLHTISVDSSTLYNHLSDMIYFLDEPQADPAPINASLICKLAKETGYKILLSGAGGDDIFSGYRRHYAIHLDKFFNYLPYFLKKSGQSLFNKVLPPSPFKRRLNKYFSHIELSDKDKLASYFLWQPEPFLKDLYQTHISERIAVNSSIKRLRDTLKNIPQETSTLNQMLYLESKHFLCDHNLNYTDKMGMEHGIEVRVPFLDLDLVNFCTQIPPHLKQHGKTGKYILKQVAKSLLPPSIISRSKSGFGAPLREWIKTKDFQTIFFDLLSNEKVKARNIFKTQSIHTLYKNTLSEEVDGAYTILSLMCIETWCRHFIDT